MIDQYLQTIKNKNTRQSHQAGLKTFFNWFKGNLDDCTFETFEAYKDYLINQNYKAQSINLKLIAIKKYMKFLHIENKIQNKAFEKIELIKINQKQWLDEATSITANEYKRLLAQAEKANDLQAIAIMKTLACTGCRVSELIKMKGLEYKNGDYEIKLGKGGKSRIVFVNNEAIEAINDYRRKRGHEENDYIFMNKFNRNHIARQEVNKLISKYGGLAKIKKTKTHPHAFRHMVGFNLIAQGVPIDQVSKYLGHTNVNTTAIYTKVTKSDLKLKIENAFNRAWGE